MNLLRVRNIRGNKLVFIIAFLLFSLASIFMPHALVESYVQHHSESAVKLVINNNKPRINIRIFLNKLRSILHKIFRLSQLLSNIVVTVNIRSALNNIHISNVAILRLFSFLCFYFHGSKYKHGRFHSDLFPLIAV